MISYIFRMLLDKLWAGISAAVISSIIWNKFLISKDAIFETSSVWCSQRHNQKFCNFANVCYYAPYKSLLFILTDHSVINGLSDVEELQQIQLSSISNHNRFFANISVLKYDHFMLLFSLAQVTYVEKAFLYSRFKPDNIMHVLHDDLIPLFLTLEEMCFGNMEKCLKQYTILTHDDSPIGPYSNMYQMFSTINWLHLKNITNNKTMLCIKELSIGLNTESVWFQYGFNKPQGPLKNTKITYSDLIRFSKFVKNQLAINEIVTEKNKLVLISRKKNRRILNEIQLLHEIGHLIKIKPSIVDLNTNNTENFIKEISSGSILIGMHGAELIFSIFMNHGLVIELFPYGIQPDAVSFIKPLANLKDCVFNYELWANNNKSNSVSPTDVDIQFGGIKHLPIETQHMIKNTSLVPPVQCCNDPNYLYHMYQDTIVGEEFINIMANALKRSDLHKPVSTNGKWFFPTEIKNLSCSLEDQTLYLKWDEPINCLDIRPCVQYSVYVLASHFSFQQQFTTQNNQLQIVLNLENTKLKTIVLKIWISSMFLFNHVVSKDQFYMCSVSQ